MTKLITNAVIQSNWLNSAEGELVLKKLCDSLTSNRKLFGILENPCITLGYEEVSYKLFITGRSCSGKAKLISILAGSSKILGESHGILKTNIYWPTKILDKILLFRLQFWDTYDTGLKKFSHILPMCLDKADAIIFVFSFDDSNSFHEISQNMSKFGINDLNQPTVMVIGINHSDFKKKAVSHLQIKEFELKWKINVIKLPENYEIDANRINSVLNLFCEKLWIRDQEYIMKESFANFSLKE